MLVVILASLLPMLLMVSIFFVHTRRRMMEQYLGKAGEKVERISQNVDEMLWNIYSVSDNFAYNEELAPYLNKTYDPEDWIYKAADIQFINRLIFEKYDQLRINEKISAIYTKKGELFNFRDSDYDGEEVIEQLLKLGIDNRENLMMLVWYPLQKDFLREMKTGEIRKDHVVIGSRRIYNHKKQRYSNIHIFTLPEKQIFEKYESEMDLPGAQVHIINGKGMLLSSSEESLVSRGRMPSALKRAVLNRTSDEFEWKENGIRYQVYVHKSQVNDWISVLSVPLRSITSTVDKLYRNIFFVIILCIVFCTIMILHFYNSFMKPVAVMNQAMQDVNRGNLNAFVKVVNQPEMGKMMGYYNEMLQSINTHVVDKLQNERRKKELEMEVLVSQISPISSIIRWKISYGNLMKPVDRISEGLQHPWDVCTGFLQVTIRSCVFSRKWNI